MSTVVVRRGHAKPLWKGHPWVYRDSVARVEKAPGAGDLVTVRDEAGRAIGCGFFSPGSIICVRMLSRQEEVAVDRAFFCRRIAQAVRLRRETLGLPVVTDAYRLVHSEGDRLPGLVVDYFGGYLITQFSTVGMHRRREMILDALEEVLSPRAIFDKPDRRACRLEGIDAHAGLLRGRAPGEPASILENGVCFRLSLQTGQKTGFYSDQRENRQFLSRFARDKRVLDLHTYTGGFGLYAAVGGAVEVLGVDSSGPALALAVENAMLNNLGKGRQVRFERADATAALNRLHAEGRRFDLVICDPPKFARTRSGLPRALRGYRDLHLRALRLVESGGLLALSSCSGLVSMQSFEQTLGEAAQDVGRTVQVLHRAGQAPDHPVATACPEGRYLKFLIACAR